MNELINYKGVNRTAPATPGLLMTLDTVLNQGTSYDYTSEFWDGQFLAARLIIFYFLISALDGANINCLMAHFKLIYMLCVF